jgi:hypothetical protein
MAGRKKREAPVSYRPPEKLRGEFLARVRNSGLSINAFITKAVFAMSAPRARKAAPLDQKQAAALLAQAAVIADRLAALPGDESASEEGLRACRDELVLIRTCLMQVLGREP